MPEFEVHLVVRPVPGAFSTVFLKRVVESPFLPRVGEWVLIGQGGWVEQVRSVWHEFGTRVVVEIGPAKGVDDITGGERLVEIARAAGWA